MCWNIHLRTGKSKGCNSRQYGIMFRNSLYEIKELRKTDSGLEAVVCLKPGCGIFRGHFPDRPVLPGVCTLSVVTELLSEALGRKVRVASLKECRFLTMTDPRTCGDLVFSLSGDGETFGGTVSSSEGTVLKIKGLKLV